MAFSELYNSFQDAKIPVSRNDVRAKIVELTGYTKINYVRMGLDTEVCRGLFLDARNSDHHLVKQFDGPIVITDRNLNRCWERFVTVKEMVHSFSDDGKIADSGAAFDSLISDLTNNPREWSGPMRSEVDAFWMGLSILCPEKDRQKFKSLLDENKIEKLDVALQLRIPENYVPRLFEPGYDKFLDDLK